MTFIVTAILLVFVIPEFESLFQGFGADLPALTKMVVNISKVFQESWYIIFGILILFIVLMAWALGMKARAYLDAKGIGRPTPTGGSCCGSKPNQSSCGCAKS